MWNAIKNYFTEFKILLQTPKEFWLLNLVINFFEMLAYFAFITVLSLYLTDNLGISDATTGDIMGYFTLAITIIIFLAGPIIDWIGIKKVLIISMLILIPTRFFMGMTDYLERKVLLKSMDQARALDAINNGQYYNKLFTSTQERMIDVQVAIVLDKQKDLSKEMLRKDSKKLLDGVINQLALSAALKSKWEMKLDKKESWQATLAVAAKDLKTYKALLTDYVLDNEALSQKYIYKLEDLSGEPLKQALAEIIIAFPELRQEFTIVDFIRKLVYFILALIAIGEALMVPAIYVSIRRFTNKKTSGAGFNFQYLTMNIGAVLSYVVFDLLRNHFGNLQGNQAILISGALCAVICTIAAIVMRSAIEVKEDGEIVKYKSEKEMRSSGEQKKENPLAIIKDVITESAFWRFMFFIIILIGVRLVFTHQFMVMPKYYTRVLGPDAQIGLLNSINPTIIVIGLILFIPLISKFSVFRLIVVGTFISAGSVFLLVIPGKVFTVLGWSIEQGYFALILAQVIVFAVGEIIWSPRLSEYTVVIAPKGREGTYMSLAVLPMFIAKPLNGLISGRLLNSYCPEGVLNDIASGARNFWSGPEFMWLIFSVIAIASPIGVLFFRKVIQGSKQEI